MDDELIRLHAIIYVLSERVKKKTKHGVRAKIRGDKFIMLDGNVTMDTFTINTHTIVIQASHDKDRSHKGYEIFNKDCARLGTDIGAVALVIRGVNDEGHEQCAYIAIKLGHYGEMVIYGRGLSMDYKMFLRGRTVVKFILNAYDKLKSNIMVMEPSKTLHRGKVMRFTI